MKPPPLRAIMSLKWKRQHLTSLHCCGLHNTIIIRQGINDDGGRWSIRLTEDQTRKKCLFDWQTDQKQLMCRRNYRSLSKQMTSGGREEVTKWCVPFALWTAGRRWGGEQEGSFHPRRLSKLLRITDIPASLSPLHTRERTLKPMAHDRPVNSACSWRLKPTGGVIWSRTCSFPLKSFKPVKWNGSKSSTEARQREQAVLSIPRDKTSSPPPVWVWLWRLSKAASGRTNILGI